PILLRFSLHRWCFRVLELEPVLRAARAVARAEPLRHDAFKAKLADVAKHDVARFVDVLVEKQARFGVAQELGEGCLARFDGRPPQRILYGAGGEANGLPFSTTKVAMAFTGDVPLLMPS